MANQKIIVAIFFSLLVFVSAQAQEITESQFTIKLTPGKYYQSYTKWFIFKIKIYPQVAVWLENEDGKYIKTLYVTEKVSKNKWISAPEEGRPEALPVWSHLQKEPCDAVTGATPKSQTLREAKLADIPKGTYIVKLEVNRSYDYNEAYTSENSGVTGQPSLIYKAILEIGDKESKAEFEPIGMGALHGEDGNINPELNNIDTAFELLQELSISWTPAL